MSSQEQTPDNSQPASAPESSTLAVARFFTEAIGYGLPLRLRRRQLKLAQPALFTPTSFGGLPANR